MGSVRGGEVLQAKTLALIGWLETLITPQGDRAGQPFELLEWERRLLNGVIDSDVSTAAMSLGRGNGKTTFSAALGAAGIMGPLAQPNAEVTLMASAFGQARIGFAHAKAFLTPWIESEPRRFSITDTSQRATIVDRHTGSSLIARGSDPRRAHGLAPVLALLDEPAQWPPSTANAMVAALTTADGKIPDALFIALGTRPADSGHWFQQWLDGGADYSQIHAATDKMPLYQRKTWLRANPALDDMPHLERAIRRHVGRAKRSDSELQSFKALRLNMGMTDTVRSVLLTTQAWQQCETADMPPMSGPLVWGVDLGSGAAMSAVSCYAPETGALECMAAFPALPDLKERGRRDGVGTLYQQMYDRHELTIAGQYTVNPALLLEYALDRWGPPAALAADRYRESDLREACSDAGIPPAALVMRGQGFRDGADDVRRFRRAVAERVVKTPVSLLLRSALGGAVTVSDPAGNHKLAKAKDTAERRDGHRDDAAAATILGVAEGQRWIARQASAEPVAAFSGFIPWD